MKHFVMVISLLIIMSALPCVAAADDWEDYLAFKSQFYYLDDQEFNSITCNIESPMLAEMVKQTKAQLSPLKDNIEVVADLSGFSMSYSKSYSKSGGLQINRPELDVVIKSEEGLADPAQARKGVDMINSGFKQVVDGLSMQLSGTLEEYTAPNREDFDELKLANAKEGLTFTYKREGSDVTETFSGNRLEIKSVNVGGEMHALQNYARTGGDKLILKDASVTINQQVGKVESGILLTYQEVGSVIFPKSIVTNISQEIQSIKQEGQMEIYLKDCKVN